MRHRSGGLSQTDSARALADAGTPAPVARDPADPVTTPLELLGAALAALLAGYIRGFTGFGGPAVLTLMLLPFYPPLFVVSKVVIVDLASNLKLLPDVYREPGWRPMWPWFVAAAATVPLGHWLALTMDADLVRRGVGVVVLGCAAVMLAGWRCRVPPPLIVGMVISALSGVLMGAVFIALPMMAYLFCLPQGAADSRAQAVLWAFATGVVLCGSQILSGTFGAGDLAPTAVLATAYLFGSVLGARSFKFASETAVRRAVLWLLMVLAVVAMAV